MERARGRVREGEGVGGSGRAGGRERRCGREHARVGKYERAAGVGEDDGAGEGGKGEGVWEREREAKASTELDVRPSESRSAFSSRVTRIWATSSDRGR